MKQIEIKNYGRFAPVCFSGDNLILYRKGKFYVFNGSDTIAEHILFTTSKYRIIEKSKLLYRLLRLGIRTAVSLDDDIIIFCVGKTIYEYDFVNRHLSEGFHTEEQARPLYFSKIEGINGFDDVVVFGGYLGNRDKKPVNIYRRVCRDTWDVIYTFEQGQINHVHNIIPDPYAECVWILTGDFGDASAIWRVTDNFNKVEKVLYGQQTYRSCVAFPTHDGLIYATDTPFKNNYLYLISRDSGIHKIGALAGSCIYGTKWKDAYVFSSTVEGDGRNETILSSFFNRKKGIGIKDSKVHLYLFREHTLKEIYSETKDIWPFAFQFGVFKFPFGSNLSDKLYFQPIATKCNDLQLLSINEKQID